jgi:SSS family solute:Na+ symporter
VGAIDYGVLTVYLGLLVGIGFYAKHRQENSEDYFVAGRRLGTVTVACLWVGAWIGGAAVVGTSTNAYQYGITASWYILAQSIGCLLFGLFAATRIHGLGDRHRLLTYPDFIEQTCGSRTRIVATVTTVLAFAAYSAGQFVAAASILQAMLGWDYESALLLAGAVVILYTAVGGYLALSYADNVQVALLLLGIVVIGIPVAIAHAGSWGDMHAVLPASYYDFGARGWDKVAALVVSIVLSFFVGMDSYSRTFAARNAATARSGALLAGVLVLPVALAVAWLGLAAAVVYPDNATPASSVLATFVLDAFPAGLKGLMVIAILAAITSTADICILTASANYARDIHQRYIRPDLTPPAMLRIGMLASVGIGLLSLLLAWKMRDIIDILQFGFTINSAGLFLPTVAALYLGRVPERAAFWSTTASLAVVIGWRLAADAGAGGIFATLNPLWPGLAVSALLLAVLSARSR